MRSSGDDNRYSTYMVSKVNIETPIAIGGVGGSGTRLVADLLMRLGFFVGTDLNDSLDNLWFTLLFKRAEIRNCSDAEFQACVDLFVGRMQGRTNLDAADRVFLEHLAEADRPQHDGPWLQERVASFCTPAVGPSPSVRWGWKEPNTHIVLPRLIRSMPAFKYIHVIRNGLDMAYSGNQNQLRLWGPGILGMDQVPIDPRHSLKYWCRVHVHLLEVFECFPGRCLLLDFDQLCMDPHRHLGELLTFIDVAPSPERIDALASLIRPPDSIGRYRGFDSSRLDRQDIATVAKLGFQTEAVIATPCAVDTQCDTPATAPRRNRTALVILGMHRSGTSAFTRVAGLLGGAVPRDLMPPVADDNDAGFWESMGIYRLNDTLLRCAGSRWDDSRELPFDWTNLQVSDGFKRRATAAICRAFGPEDLIVIKDPRICRIFPFWKDVLQEMEMDVLCLLPVRNPLEVAASLRRRDGFDPAKSYLLWLRHTLDAEAATRGLRRSIATFDHLMSDWRDCTMRIQKDLASTWPRAFEKEAAQGIECFLQERLRHNHASAQDLDNDTGVPQWVKETFSSLLELIDHPDSADALSALDRVRDELRQADRVIRPALGIEALARTQRTRTIGAIRPSLDREKARTHALESALTRHQSEAKALRSEIRALETRATELESALARSGSIAEERIAELTLRGDRFEQQRDQIAFRLNALQSSATWQIGRYLFRAEQRFPATFRRLLAIPKVTYWTLTMRFRSRLRLRSELQRIQASGLFDEGWYLRTYPEMLASGYRAPIHWSLVGWRNGYCPNPLFDTTWYLEHNPDVRDTGVDPLIHYFSRGAFEGRDPHPQFSSRWYLEQNPDVAQAGINPLTHFLRTGWLERRAPNPRFNVAGYLSSHPDLVAAKMNPLVHYLVNGGNDRRDSQPSGDSGPGAYSAGQRLDGLA